MSSKMLAYDSTITSCSMFQGLQASCAWAMVVTKKTYHWETFTNWTSNGSLFGVFVMGLKTHNEFHEFIYFPIHTKLAPCDFGKLYFFSKNKTPSISYQNSIDDNVIYNSHKGLDSSILCGGPLTQENVHCWMKDKCLL